MRTLRYLLFLTSLAKVATCWRSILPSQTIYAQDGVDIMGWTPIPTSLPGPFGHIKRQNTPNDLCGYVSGDYNEALTCVSNSYCAENSGLGAIGCCSSYYLDNDTYTLDGCTYHTLCYYSTYATSVCTSGNTICSDSLLLQCTDAEAPYCFEYSFTDNGYSYLGCTSVGSPVTIEAGFHYISSVSSSNPSSPSVSSSLPVASQSASASGGAGTTPTTTSTTTTTTTTTTSFTTSPPLSSLYSSSTPSSSFSSSYSYTTQVVSITATPVTMSTTNTAFNAAASSSSSNPTPTPVPSKNIGAIAGGAAGGAVFLALLALLGFLLYRRKRNAEPVQEVSHYYDSTPQPYSPATQYTNRTTPMSQNSSFPSYEPVSQDGYGFQYQATHPAPQVAELPHTGGYQIYR